MTDPAARLDRRALARAISAVENGTAAGDEILRRAYGAPGRAQVIGITGPPGAGKSTMVDALAAHWARRGEAIAVLAVDPSSPYSGGAVLGDRIRMDRSAAFPDIYFRSLSSRGQGGGVSAATADILVVLGHAGFARVLVETVGAGQSDVDVMNLADCIVLVSVPGLGDQVQASKAGLMEIGDVHAVNKADLPAARQTVAEIDRALAASYMGAPGVNRWDPAKRHGATHTLSVGVVELNRRHGDPGAEPATWRPPVVELTATTGAGLDRLADATEAFMDWAERTGRAARKRRERIEQQLLRLLTARLLAPFLPDGAGVSPLARHVDEIVAGRASPAETVERIAAPHLRLELVS